LSATPPVRDPVIGNWWLTSAWARSVWC